MSLRYVAPLRSQLRHLVAKVPKHGKPTAVTSHDNDESTGQRLAEHTAAGLGSWKFIGIQACAMLLWIIFNTMPFLILVHFDPFPFVFLNLTMSAEAAFTGPILLIAANVGAMRDHRQYDRIEALIAVNVEQSKLIATLVERIDKMEEARNAA